MARPASRVVVAAASPGWAAAGSPVSALQAVTTCSSPSSAERPMARPGSKRPESTLSPRNRRQGDDLVVIGDCNPDVLVVGDDVAPSFGQREKLVESMSLVIGGSAAITAG